MILSPGPYDVIEIGWLTPRQKDDESGICAADTCTMPRRCDDGADAVSIATFFRAQTFLTATCRRDDTTAKIPGRLCMQRANGRAGLDAFSGIICRQISPRESHMTRRYAQHAHTRASIADARMIAWHVVGTRAFGSTCRRHADDFSHDMNARRAKRPLRAVSRHHHAPDAHMHILDARLFSL